jgi:hypothetical protein
VRELFAELGSAASVDITEYAAERVVPDRIAPVARPWPATAPVSPSSWGAG